MSLTYATIAEADADRAQQLRLQAALDARQSLGSTDSSESGASHAFPRHAGAQKLFCLLEPISV